MDNVYALGVTCIQFIQEWFADYASYFETVNNLSNPNNVMDIFFPVVSIVDSVFGAQLLLCVAFGGWLNAVMKWWFLEDRPYWWVRETSYYNGGRRPVLLQTDQSCETGPGSPSGHSTITSMVLMLGIMWFSHIMNDRKINLRYWTHIVYPCCMWALGSVMMARMFVATHFPHQCLLGALIGAFLAPALCIYVSDPYIWQRVVGPADVGVKRAMFWHCFSSAAAIAIAGVTYLSLVMCGWDPYWTVKLAFRWCEHPEHIHVSTTPIFSLVQCTGSLMGWAIAVTPAVSKYRHYTKSRSILISTFITVLSLYSFKYLQDGICKNDAKRYYAFQFLLWCLKPAFILRLAPALAMWPYTKDVKIKNE